MADSGSKYPPEKLRGKVGRAGRLPVLELLGLDVITEDRGKFSTLLDFSRLLGRLP